MVTTLGDEWKLHRKITSRTFSERNNQLVHSETTNQASQMMASWERRMKDNSLILEEYNLCLPRPAHYSVRNETMKIALHVICAAGYGYFFDWESSENACRSSVPLTTESSEELVEGHMLSFRDSLQFTLDNLITLIALPKLFLHFPFEHLKKTGIAYTEFGNYLYGLVKLGKSRLDGRRAKGANSILNALVASSDEVQEKGRERLTDEEIVGNAFIFLLAGHETTFVPFLNNHLSQVLTHCFMHFIF